MILCHKREGVQQLLQRLPQWESFCGAGALPVFNALSKCRTEALGWHLYRCANQNCNGVKMQYHSCRNRHCPNCGGMKKEEWIEARRRELLPCKYYHVVFTVPHALNGIFMGNRKAMFSLLFETSSYTLQKFSKDEKYLGAKPGIISVLHTWGQTLSFHPHVHCIVSGGGESVTGEWKEARKAKYGRLFPVQAMETVYRARFLRRVKKLVKEEKLTLKDPAEFQKLCRELYTQRWIVYAKEPFGGPQQVIEYLGRYTHKVAISNHRIKKIDIQNRVTFQYKDYADESKKKIVTLEGQEFLRRFEQHILPKGFCKIRSYGIYTNNGRGTRINGILKRMKLPLHGPKVEIPWYIRYLEHYGVDPLLCPCCKKEKMILCEVSLPGRKEVLRE